MTKLLTVDRWLRLSPGCCWGGRAWARGAASEDLREFCDDCPSSLSSGDGWSEKN
jgi:hypothetical protein